ncbi:putative bifunctional diguanylate cyclase/phosphodiesterase [Herminiimonas fonticola]|uniref:PAS domain S-box-containing protein/diguanylate cyclase (GGDEF)-like protein n=1 Tax=Herminiimonas fonticola TaxID=303380 RepID=A0A4R6G688_9BURK|nr:bifunctional diguanylate cyclase/phosphodiesterase [Herminiimonas fonticola]RBA23983.1 GGDEF: diguanylate cyclase (GGDEF) domain [Herminiimonas fonticola]TDN89983.1 PAS domain S-box-containing protein/diguanylate cyclase (GGDEF)-like protein [Herminiimonas fonticola]
MPSHPSDPTLQARLLGTLLANLEGMVYRCRLDAHWTMEFVSEGCLALTGHPEEDILFNSRVSYDDITHPDDRDLVRNAVLAAVKNNRRFDIEYRIVRADGEVRWVWERGTNISHDNKQWDVLEGFIQDITERRQADEALREAERRYRSIFENAIEGIYQSTPGNGYLAVNPALARMYGYNSPHDLISTLKDIEHQVYVEPKRRIEFMQLMLKNGVVTNFESRIYKRDGEIIWISENARAVFNSTGDLVFYEGTVEAITERKLHEAEIQFQATHDALTGLPNRTLLYDRMQQAVLHSERYSNITAIAFLDLDQFKFINDSLGHQVGDELLKITAQRLTSCLRESDTVARQGGDEFVLLLTSQPDEESITQTMQRVLHEVSQPWMANDLEFRITCSIGVTLCPDDGRDVETLLKNADSAMYKAKELGRNNFQYFAAEMNDTVTDRLALLNRLRQAIPNNEFVLHYQPKVDLGSGKIIGSEALIRWNSPEGTVSPANFIPLAEETGLIIQIGEWVLRTACRQNRTWQLAGHPPIPVSVNLSPRQLARGDIVELVERILAETGMEAKYLELEITESVMATDVEKSFSLLTRLRALGVKISLDDFGTGYSSLSYLKRFPVDTLKIDQSFVRDIATNPDSAAIIKAIISLGHNLNLTVLAEGIETEEHFQFLLKNGCNEGQGYLMSKPVSNHAFIKLLHEGIRQYS